MCGITLLLERALDTPASVPPLLTDPQLAQEIEHRLGQRGPDHFGFVDRSVGGANGANDGNDACAWRMRLCSAVLHLRGDALTPQPLEDADGNVLCWNGEVFGLDSDGNDDSARVIATGNDTQWLSDRLYHASSSPSDATDEILSTLKQIHGPFAFVWFHAATKRLFFGHDRFGRRSLLIHTDQEELQHQILSLSSSPVDLCGLQRLVLSSVALPATCSSSSPRFFDEVPSAGIYELDLVAQQLHYHAHTPLVSTQCLATAIPTVQDAYACGLPSTVTTAASPLEAAAQGLLTSLSNAVGVRIRTIPPRPVRSQDPQNPHDRQARVGVLFSGGLDSVVLAALAHYHVQDPFEPIELLNVCFDAGSQFQSPDRLAAQISFRELCTLFPTRTWSFIHVNVAYERVLAQQNEILQLLAPCDTQMDLNIGAAFWFLAKGEGHESSERDDVVHDLNGFLTATRVSSEQLQREAAIQRLQLFPESDSCDDMSSTVWCPVASCKRKSKPGCALRVCRVCCLKIQKLLAKSCCSLHANEVDASRRQLTAMLPCKQSDLMEKLLRVYAAHWRGANQRELCRVHREKTKTTASQAPPAVPAPVPRESGELQDTELSTPKDLEAPPTTTTTSGAARVLLVGIGADEQLGGYGRHKTAYLQHGADGLRRELARDMARIWKRNLGRDDRCISAHGREARFPFLDERVVAFIASLPMDCVCDFDTLQRGEGDKRVLRVAARRLGLANCATLAKRAIQFGTRIAKHANALAFGSNRQATGDAKIRRRAQEPGGEEEA